MTISKEPKSLGMPWEKEYGYSQAVKVDNTICVSGQVSHDDKGNIVGRGEMQVQMRQAYANIEKVLAQYGATMGNIVDEVLFVTDMDAAFSKGQMQAGGLFWQPGAGKHYCADTASDIP